jgi:hypothetical protein
MTGDVDRTSATPDRVPVSFVTTGEFNSVFTWPIKDN